MTRVLLDVSPIGSRPEARTGLARVALDLASSLADLPDVSLATCAWGSVEASRQFRAVRAEFPRLAGLETTPGLCERLFLAASSRISPGSLLSRTLLRRAGQVLNVCRDPLRGHDLRQFDVVHSTYARIPRVVRRRARRCIMTVHDLIPLKVPPRVMPRHLVGINTRIMRSIQPSDWVVCVSEHTRRDFLAYIKHPVDRTVVIPNGVDHRLFHPVTDAGDLGVMRARFGLGDRPFVLTLSSLAPHKNLAMLAAIWPEVRRRCPDGILVVAGGAAAQRDEVERLFRARDDAGVRVTGFVPDEGFRSLASACQAFLFPSLYEGFGLPILEAMACGAPVICSDAAAIPEVVGDTAAMVDPHDTAAWTARVADALTAPVRNLPHEGSIRRAGLFSWNRCAQEHAALYRRVAAE
mgnify:CR=1 FL=1